MGPKDATFLTGTIHAGALLLAVSILSTAQYNRHLSLLISSLSMASVNPTPVPPPAPAGKPDGKWPGWPGQNAFRLIVPGRAVGCLIDHGGHIIKRISDQTGARLQVIAPPAGNTDRIVLITATEEPHLKQSPAMNAVIEVCKRVTGMLHVDANGVASRASLVTVTFLVGCPQSLTLLGRNGSTLREIERSSGTIIGILSNGYAGVPFYVSQDERLIKIQGQVLKVMTAVREVINHLRRYLVDISVIPAFCEKYKIGNWQPDQRLSAHHSAPAYQPGGDSGYPLPLIEHGAELNAGIPSYHSSFYAPVPVPGGGLPSIEYGDEVNAGIPSSHSSFYAPVPVPAGGLPLISIERGAEVNAGIPSPHSSFYAPMPVPAQRMQRIQIPYAVAKHIIGIGSETIDHIRRTSGSIITIDGDSNLVDQYILEIRGTTSQLQTAQQLIEELLWKHYQAEREASLTSWVQN